MSLTSSSHTDLRVYLSQIPYFRTLSASQLTALATQSLLRRFAENEIIFLENEPAVGLWIVSEGTVKIYRVNPEGREHILHLRGPGDSFNEIAALDGGPNPATAAALSEVSAWVLPSAVLSDMLETDPGFARHVVGFLTSRVRTLIHQMEDLVLYSVPARLARFLLSQEADPSLEGPGVTRAAIASHLATTPETISRALRMLEDAGAIRFDRHRILIINEALLRDLAML